MKTVEQMADEHTRDWWPDYNGVERCSQVHAATRQAFLAGFQAAKDQLAEWNSVDAVGDSIDRSAIQHALAVLKKKPLPQWIRINERWPNFDELVLVYIPSAAEWQRIRTTLRLQPEPWHNGLIPRFSTVPRGAVTHWMPLPELPTV